MSERIHIFDTTLRDGDQAPGAGMTGAEKLSVALQLERLGVDTIEAGFPISSPGEFEAVSDIAGTIRTAEVAALARANRKDIDMAWGAIRHADAPRIHVFISSSDLHMEHKLGMTREQVLEATIEAVRYASSLCENVEFSTEDGSRSDRDFLCKLFGAAIANGATTIDLADTVGYAMPGEFADLVRYILDHTPDSHRARMGVHCHDDLGLATANTLAAIQAGARHIEVTVNGIGERAGNTPLEEVVMAMRTRPGHFPYECGIRTEHLYGASRLVSKCTGFEVQPNKAVVGANAFAHESGIHQDGVLKNSMTYEIMEPSAVGVRSNRMVMGRHSGRHGLKWRLAQLGYAVEGDALSALYDRFKEIADSRKEVDDDALVGLAHDLGLSRMSASDNGHDTKVDKDPVAAAAR
jgi:2-isopropylmalate synthase